MRRAGALLSESRGQGGRTRSTFPIVTAAFDCAFPGRVQCTLHRTLAEVLPIRTAAVQPFRPLIKSSMVLLRRSQSRCPAPRARPSEDELRVLLKLGSRVTKRRDSPAADANENKSGFQVWEYGQNGGKKK